MHHDLMGDQLKASALQGLALRAKVDPCSDQARWVEPGHAGGSMFDQRFNGWNTYLHLFEDIPIYPKTLGFFAKIRTPGAGLL